jgi:putative ABC transport system permease protein
LDSFWKDIRFGLRTLAKAPGTTLAALIALALGIGANSAIFSVVSGVLLKPLPYPRPDQLMVVMAKNPEAGFPRFSVSVPDFEDWRRQNRSFQQMVALSPGRFNLTTGDRPEALQGARVSADFFTALKLEPILGRGFRADEDRAGGERVVVLSEGLWRRRFGAAPGIIGRAVTLDGEPRTVVGVAPPGLDFPAKSELWLPLAVDPAKESRGGHYLMVLGRLKPGTSQRQAGAEMAAIAGRLERQYPDSNSGWGTLLIPLAELQVEKIRTILLILLVFVSFVLLIACADVANLLLARVAAREREMALRAALGADRARLVRQMLTETLVLFLAGGALGLLLAHWGIKALIALNPDGIPRSREVRLDGAVLLFTLAVSLATGVLFGLVPALSSAGRHLSASLKEGGRAVAGGVRGRLVRNSLVLAQVALTLVLLIGAGLLLQSFARLQAVNPGFHPQGVLTVKLELPEAKYPDAKRQIVFYRELLERVRALPGVDQAGFLFPLPLGGNKMILAFSVAGRPDPPPNAVPSTNVRTATPGALQALRVPLRRGRLFDERDNESGMPVLLVNETLAAQVWPGEDPLGKRITFDNNKDPKARWYTVVGVVGDVRHQALSEEAGAEAYWPQFQDPITSATLLVRGAGDPGRLTAPVREAVRALDPDLPLDKVAPLDDVVAASLAQSRFKAVLLALFAGLALVLALVGVYGVVSYTVSQRTHEIGIRMALGAQRDQVLRLVVRQGMTQVLIGLALGLAGAWFASRFLAGQVYGLSATDPVTFVAVPLGLAAVALVANYLPARRATRVDPLTALRQD